MRTLLTLFTGFVLFGSLADAEGTQPRVKRVSSSAVGPNDFESEQGSRTDRQSNGGKAYDFPIILPPYNYETLSAKDFGSCLLYIESIAVVVFATENQVVNKRDFISAAAVIKNGSQFLFDSDTVQCLDKSNQTYDSRNFYFHIKVDIKDKVVAKAGPDSLFYVDKNLDFVLHFKVNADSSWNLEDVELKEDLVAEPDGWLKSAVSARAGVKSDNAARVLFGGFKDYGYACSSTPLVAWTSPGNPAIGLSFNNIQLQAFYSISVNLTKPDRTIRRFSTNVNDCVGTFSVGSWMAIVVVLVLLGVLAFGYLMLNSVQTMDRFDDPKQKQLIINAKE